MNIEEIRKNAPEGATHYIMNKDFASYFKAEDIILYEWINRSWDTVSLEFINVVLEMIKPLYPTQEENLNLLKTDIFDDQKDFTKRIEDAVSILGEPKNKPNLVLDSSKPQESANNPINPSHYKQGIDKMEKAQPTHGEYKETNYKCGAVSTSKISVNIEKSTTAKILAERQEQYGNYSDVARITQEIKESISNGETYHLLSDEQKLSLDMIANKMARAVNGDTKYVDNWQDICGYSQLVIDSLNKGK